MSLTELGGLLPLALIHTPGHDFLNISLSLSARIDRRPSKFCWFNFYEIAAGSTIGVLNFDVKIHEVSMNSIVNR